MPHFARVRDGTWSALVYLASMLAGTAVNKIATLDECIAVVLEGR